MPDMLLVRFLCRYNGQYRRITLPGVPYIMPQLKYFHYPTVNNIVLKVADPVENPASNYNHF
jgi:hypothetical protein